MKHVISLLLVCFTLGCSSNRAGVRDWDYDNCYETEWKDAGDDISGQLTMTVDDLNLQTDSEITYRISKSSSQDWSYGQGFNLYRMSKDGEWIFFTSLRCDGVMTESAQYFTMSDPDSITEGKIPTALFKNRLRKGKYRLEKCFEGTSGQCGVIGAEFEVR